MEEKYAFFVDEGKPWFRPEAGWPDVVPKNYHFPNITLYEMLSEAVEKYADLPAAWFLNSFMTYQELLGHVDAAASGLHRLGLKKGDVMALALPSCFQYVVLNYACAKLGVIVSGVNPTLTPPEIANQLKKFSNGNLAILDALYEPLIKPIREQISINNLITTNIADMLKVSPLKKWLGKKLKKIPTGPVPDSAVSFHELIKEPSEDIQVPVSAEDTAAYVMTGGTTGIPKATILTHFNCVANAIQVSLWMTTKEPGASMVGIIPLFHSFGMSAVMNASLYSGSLYSGMWMMLFPRPPETRDLIQTICKIAPDNQTYFPGVEILFRKIAEFPDIQKFPIEKKLRACISGAGPLREEVKSLFEEKTGAPLLEGYGLTEASPVVSGGPLGTVKTTGTLGLPLTGLEWKIMDMETGTRELKPGEKGELFVTGPTIMEGYLDAPEETEAAIKVQDSKRWLRTGDIGFMDDHGRAVLSDRKKQLIKVKGYSVFPKDVEELIASHQGVRDVAVAGLPDRETGEAVKAWVVPTETGGPSITDMALKQWCQENMAQYKVPKYIEFLEEIPRNNLGKVMRRELQEKDPLYQQEFP
jgi:long-chain acyl-CoA synthetase